MKRKLLCFSYVLILSTFIGFSQGAKYKYSVDLTAVDNDQLRVNLETPSIKDNKISFFMPKIIPGTYRESDFGKFVSDFKAFDHSGNELPIKRMGDNEWEINKAKKLHSVTYLVEDIFDTEIENKIYRMSATNIDANENFVLSTPGFFGYFEGLKELPFQLDIKKPEGFYGSTGLKPVHTDNQKDTFLTTDYDELMDSPLMYNIPDTTNIHVDGAQILVSVYSKNNVYNSKMIADKIAPILKAESEYMGGTLPTDKYAFIMYFEDPAQTSPLQGALEHNISSFYYLPEMNPEALLPSLMDIAAHEFFHIITPLTIHSEEIQNFDYNTPVLSKHLWLYEGVTEYTSDHVQVKYGLTNPEEYLNKLALKIQNAKTKYNDQLSFTELSENAATLHSDQYANVYEKGALIAAMLDIRLLELSNGDFNLMDLLQKLSDKYGKDKPFKDNELFEEIKKLSNLDIEDFFSKYVAGSDPLPFEQYFNAVGVNYTEEEEKKVASLGHVGLGFNQEKNHFFVSNNSDLDSFGKAIGYQAGDLLYTVNGEELTPTNIQQLIKNFSEKTKENEEVTVELGRKNESGEYERMAITAPALIKTVPGGIKLSISNQPTSKQLRLRNIWLKNNPADPKDVESIDALMTAFYDVISGPAGKRNWNRFHSLFSEEAQMTSLSKDAAGNDIMKTITPRDYQQMNSPFFEKNGFWEEELGRKSSVYWNAASISSTYGYSLEENTPPSQRGVNFISLAKQHGRWYITNVLWNHETPQNPIPNEYLNYSE